MNRVEFLDRSRREALKQFKSEGQTMMWDETPFVACDTACLALKEPVTLEEYKAAWEHWRDHSEMGGCSHGS